MITVTVTSRKVRSINIVFKWFIVTRLIMQTVQRVQGVKRMHACRKFKYLAIRKNSQ